MTLIAPMSLIALITPMTLIAPMSSLSFAAHLREKTAIDASETVKQIGDVRF